MMQRYVKDKFGHVLSHPQPMEVDEEVVSSGYRSVAKAVSRDYLEKYYVSKVEHERLMMELSQELRSYVDDALKLCMQLTSDRSSWDGRNLSITNVAEGEALSDVSIIKQTCTYGSSVMNFKCGNGYFNLVENSTNEQVVCFTTNHDGEQIFAAYGEDKREVIPTTALKWHREKQALTDFKNKELVWDEVNQKFQYLASLDGDRSKIAILQQSKESGGRIEERSWDGRSLRLTNLAEGRDSNDACTMKQVLVYDEEKKVFRCGSKEFNLVINTPTAPVVVLDDPRGTWPELREYGTLKKVKYMSMMQWDWRRAGVNHPVRDWKERRIVWNEETKGFALAEDIVKE